jgi:hypothetical protein
LHSSLTIQPCNNKSIKQVSNATISNLTLNSNCGFFSASSYRFFNLLWLKH